MFWVYKRSPSSYLTVRRHCDSVLPADAADVPLTYVDTKTGHRTHVTAKEGDNLLHTAHKHGVDLEGACECSLACSTCHVILEDSVYDSLDAPTDREEDLLDLAFGLTARCASLSLPPFSRAQETILVLVVPLVPLQLTTRLPG
jgi:ferredoxin